MAILSMNDIRRTYVQGERKLDILLGVDLKINESEIVGLVGTSGSGKSTLLQIAGLLDTQSSGDYQLNGKHVDVMSERERTTARLSTLGFVYQSHHLLPDFTALENVMMPMLIAGKAQKVSKKHAEELLGDIGLAERLDHMPSQLSGGEQQRVAIARALANDPALLLADEPTGNLDWQAANRVMDMLIDQMRSRGLSALIVTHDREIAARADRSLQLSEGVITPLP